MICILYMNVKLGGDNELLKHQSHQMFFVYWFTLDLHLVMLSFVIFPNPLICKDMCIVLMFSHFLAWSYEFLPDHR